MRKIGWNVNYRQPRGVIRLDAHGKRSLRRAALLSAAIVVMGVTVWAPAANASRCEKAAINQYSEGCQQPGNGGGNKDANNGDNQSDNANSNGVSGGGASGSIGGGGGGGGGGGNLPFTGYPLTSLVEILALMLAAGILIRLGVASRDRFRGPPERSET
jgi:hypothetical protein